MKVVVNYSVEQHYSTLVDVTQEELEILESSDTISYSTSNFGGTCNMLYCKLYDAMNDDNPYDKGNFNIRISK